MDYPARYFQRLFSGMRPLEVARRFAIYSCILFFLIAILAGAIVILHKSQNVRPYFLYTASNGEWVVYSEKLKAGTEALQWHQLMMESLATRFITNYFYISDNQARNDNIWCKTNNCQVNLSTCKLFCESRGNIFEYFEKEILPKWKDLQTKGKTQELVKSSLIINHLGEITATEGGLLKINGILKTSDGESKKIIAFVKINFSNLNEFPQTLGFYVSEFYFYEDK